MKIAIALGLLVGASFVHAADTFDAAAAFGARPSANDVRIAPDGKHISYLTPMAGRGTVLFTVGLETGDKPRAALLSKGAPDRLSGCAWLADDRLVCRIYGIYKNSSYLGMRDSTELIAVDMDSRNLKSLSSLNQSTSNVHLSSGLNVLSDSIIDWQPDQSGALLMARAYFADSVTGSLVGSADHGLGVDEVDTRTLAITHLERPDPAAFDYISDGHGTVRIKGTFVTEGDGSRSVRISKLRYLYRLPGSREWKLLGYYDEGTGDGFRPLAVDGQKNIVYGVKHKDGRRAIYSISLDGSLNEQLVYARPDVDVSRLFRIGRDERVVGAEYDTDGTHTEFFDDGIRKMLASLHKALPGTMLRLIDSTSDGNQMILFSSGDTNSGEYYLFDQPAHKLRPLLLSREPLNGVKLAIQKPISYPARDGVQIPAYLTLPAGHQDLKGLPAIVLPHGGPSARDVQGFNWLVQFFANRGFAVIQPEFRGSAGFGDAWFEHNGFQSWQVAINDVLDAGHWLVSQGVDPGKLGVVGWSYGGYAALQSAVVDSTTFKAVIAIAPVTDLEELKAQNYDHHSKALDDLLASGPYLREGSPQQHASAIKVPVLMFHGTFDINVSVNQSRHLADRLKAAGNPCELVIFDGLDHELEDSAARTQMLRRSDEFLRQAFGLPAQ